MQTITTPAGIYTPPATALIQKVQLRIFESCPSATLCLMQYDRALPVIAVELFEGGNPYKVPENAAVNIRMVKPDKTTVYNPALGVSSDRKTTYIGITPQMTACFGSCAATLEIALNDGVLGTGLLRLNIEKNPVSEDAVESSDEYLSLQEIVNKVQTYADQASTAAELAMNSVQAVVSVNAQTFTKEQKAQARANIGAAAVGEGGSAAKAVLYETQTLDDDQKAQARENIGAASLEDAENKASAEVGKHNTNTNAHADLRMELKALADRINAALDSDDTTLDELSEIVAYIKSNKSLIDAITISKVNVSDIVNDLVTNVGNRPLSAAQGVELKALIDAVEETAKGLDITEFKELSDEQRTAARTNIAAVSYEANQGLNDFARYNARTNIKAVSYEAALQTPLTEEEKEQARKNIGAASPADLTAATEKAVTYDSTQTLTAMQQAAARENIGAAPTSHTDNSGNYGKATFSLYGHVRLMDGANKSQNTDGGFAATPYALWRETSNRVSVEAQELTEEQKEQARANIGAAMTNHASLDKDLYGAGGGSKYGHVKLSSSISSDADENGGTAATPHAVKTVYDWAFGQNKENVKFTAQTLTDAQKAQARANIGAAAVGGGGGWVQPDWEAAEGADGHIKNRTHWVDLEYTEVVPIKDITVMSSTVPNATDTTTGAYADIVEGSKVRVYWNGTWYDRTAFVSGNAVYIGNYRVISSTGENTGEPFLLKKVSADRMTIYPRTPLAGAQVVFDYGLKLGEPVYHKLPGKFLPDGVPYVEKIQAKGLPETTLELTEQEGMMIAYVTNVVDVSVGGLFTVTYNGVEYECEAVDSNGAAALGNIALLDGSGNTGEPFIIIVLSEEMAADSGFGLMVIAIDGSTRVTLKIDGYNKIVHKMSDECMPVFGSPVFDTTKYEYNYIPADGGSGVVIVLDETDRAALQKMLKYGIVRFVVVMEMPTEDGSTTTSYECPVNMISDVVGISNIRGACFLPDGTYLYVAILNGELTLQKKKLV